MKNISFLPRTLRGIMLAPAIALLLGIAPLSALATTIPVTTYAELQAATASGVGAAGDVIKLGGDITNGTEQLTIGHDLVLDLNGHSLTIKVTAANTNGIKIDGCTLTIIDSNPSATNKLTVINHSYVRDLGYGAVGNILITGENTVVTATGGTDARDIGGGWYGDGW